MFGYTAILIVHHGDPMQYSFDRVVEMLWDGLRSNADAAKLIGAEWQSISPERSLEQAIEVAFSRHAVSGYGTEISLQRQQETFAIELGGLIEPIVLAENDDSSISG